ncbi:Ankyrin repeat protein [Rickettsiales bacterium Ac37b]|nr:Ankyrin repeat protein [Rickettsiales bacterium Ac37b]
MLAAICKEFFEVVNNNQIHILETFLNSENGKILLDERDSDNKTALYIAAEKGFIEIAKILVKYDANKEIMYNDKTPLVAAIINGYTDIVNLFIRSGADLDGIHMVDYFPLYYALKENRLEVASILIDYGAVLPIKLIKWETDSGLGKKLVWNRRGAGYIDIPNTFHNIIIIGLLADSIYEGDITKFHEYLNPEIELEKICIRLTSLCLLHRNFGRIREIKPFLCLGIRSPIEKLIEYIKATPEQIVNSIEQPLAIILNHKFPDKFPSKEPYSKISPFTQDPSLKQNLASYGKNYNLTPEGFFKEILQENRQRKILFLLEEYPNETQMIFQNIDQLLLEDHQRSQINSLKKNYIKGQNVDLMKDIVEKTHQLSERTVYLENIIDKQQRNITFLYQRFEAQEKRLKKIMSNINVDEQYREQWQSNSDIIGKFTAEIVNNKNKETLSPSKN